MHLYIDHLQGYILKRVVVRIICVLKHLKVSHLSVQGRLTKSLKNPVVKWNAVSCRAVRYDRNM